MTQTYVHGDAVPVIGGAYRAKRAVVDYLEAELPIIYPNLGRIWDLQTEQQWIAPNKIYDFEAIRLNPSEFPVMVVAVLNTGAVTPMGPDDVTGDTLFYVDYNMRIYAWMRAATADLVSKLRDYQTASLRVALTRRATLRPSSDRTINSDLDMKMRPETLTEDYSEITGHGQNSFIAGSFVTFHLSILERAGSEIVSTDLTQPPSGGFTPTADVRGTTGSDNSRPTFDMS